MVDQVANQRSVSGLVDKYINSSYDKVVSVADNIGDVTKVANLPDLAAIGVFADSVNVGVAGIEASKNAAALSATNAANSATQASGYKDITQANVVKTNADVVKTNADVTKTNSNVVITSNDVITTNADVLLTHADVILTHADVVKTNADVVATNTNKTAAINAATAAEASKVASAGNATSTANDVVTTNANVVKTNADVVTTTAKALEAANSATSATNSAVIATAKALEAQVAKIEWKGGWVAGSYNARDAVGKDNSSFIANKTTTEVPSIAAIDWDLLALKGTDGASGSGSGDMLGVNNLSDLTDKAIARNNLNVDVKGTVNATDATLPFSDITDNNVSTIKHGFAPKLPNDNTKFLNGIGTYTVPVITVNETTFNTSDITTGNVSTVKHGLMPKLPNDATKFFNGVGNYVVVDKTLIGLSNVDNTSDATLLSQVTTLINANSPEYLELSDGVLVKKNGIYGINAGVGFTTPITLPDIDFKEKITFRWISGVLKDTPVRITLPAGHTMHGQSGYIDWGVESAKLELFKTGTTTWGYSLGSLTTEKII